MSQKRRPAIAAETELDKKPWQGNYEQSGIMALGNENIRVSDSHARSFIKAMSWRVTALIVTVTVVWLVTNEVAFAVSVGVLDTLIKIGLYYLHERAWNRSRFGLRTG